MAITLSQSAFKSKLSELRSKKDPEIALDLLKDAPAVVSFRVGSDDFRVMASDLVVETGNRFLLSLDTVIHIEPADAPAAKVAFEMIAINAPKELTVEEIVDTIASLTYLNAWDCIESMADYVKGADIPTHARLGILSASIRFTKGSALTAALSIVPVSREDVPTFWDSVVPLGDRDMCLRYAFGGGTAFNRFAWWTAAALSCDASCEGRGMLVPSEMVELADSTTMDFMSRCRIWCGCRSKIVAAKKHVDAAVYTPFLVSQTRDGFVIACKVDPSIMRNPVSTASPAIEVSIADEKFAAKIVARCTTKSTTRTGYWGAYLEMRPAPSKIRLDFGYTSDMADLFKIDGLSQMTMKRCHWVAKPGDIDYGFSKFRNISNDSEYVVVRASLPDV
jgi:hypothetical protein